MIVDAYKFQTCANRSKDEVSTVEKTCCDEQIVVGYICAIRKNIKKLTPQICEACPLYKDNQAGNREAPTVFSG